MSFTTSPVSLKAIRKYYELMMDTADLLITSAHYNVADFRMYARISPSEKIVPPVEAIGLPVELGPQVTAEIFHEITPTRRRLNSQNFCLCVGYVGPRKNHFELLQAWKKYYESDVYNNEVLVVVGTPWQSAQDIVDLLRDKNFCGGTIVYLENPSNAELAYLYEKCRFTLCLFLFEGWGLSVSESIAEDKPVVILNETTLPEAGYGVATAVDTRNLKVMQMMIDCMFNDEGFYKESLKRVNDARPNLPTRSVFSQRFLQSVKKHCV